MAMTAAPTSWGVTWQVNWEIYDNLAKHLGRQPTQQEYINTCRWLRSDPSWTPAAAPQPATAVPPQAVGRIGDWTVTPEGEWQYGGATQPTQPAQPIVTTPGGQPADVFNPALYEFEQNLALQQAADNAAMERARLAAQTQQAQIASQAQISAEQNRAMLERLRYQVGVSLQQALMTHDINRAQLTMDVAQLGADPRSAVGFLEFLGKAGGGPTAISQNLAAGIEPSPVWEYFPETGTMGPEAQRLYQTLEGFISGIGG